MTASPCPTVAVLPVPGGYDLVWLGQRFAAKPEPDYARACEVAAWLGQMTSAERREWLEGVL